jgi:hypothetical protein
LKNRNNHCYGRIYRLHNKVIASVGDAGFALHALYEPRDFSRNKVFQSYVMLHAIYRFDIGGKQ